MAHHPQTVKIVRCGALGVFGLACAFLWSSNQEAQARPQGRTTYAKDPWKDNKDILYENAEACSECHTSPNAKAKAKGNLDLVLLVEYPIWKTHDKHAQAYAVLEGPRGKKMSKLLYGDEKAVTQEAGGCLSCHAMLNFSKENIRKTGKGGLDNQDGVSCGGCHGPSRKWTDEHRRPEWREMTPAYKESVGMRDLRDPLKRSELCMSCHVGNAGEGKVATHAMFAAGHPPLPPIEISSFSRNLPQHWRDPQFVPYFKKNANDKKVIDNYHLNAMAYQRSRFALVGGVVALRESMRLARDQAEAAEKESANWPEIAMAHSDCYSCHHDLQYPGWRQARGFGYQLAGRPPIKTTPGRPLVRTWPVGLVEFGLEFAKKPNEIDKFDQLLRGIAKATGSRPYGNPSEVRAAADKIVGWCDEILKDVNNPGMFNKKAALDFMNKVAGVYSKAGGLTPDYESARQVASVLMALYEEVLIDELGKDASNEKLLNAEKKTREVFGALDKSLDLQPFKNRAARTKVILDMVAEKAKIKDNPEMVASEKVFSDFAANVNFGDLDKMLDNAFVNAFSIKVTNEMFTAGLKETKVVDELQKLSDKDEQGVLDAIKTYDPAVFKDQLDKAAKQFPKP